MRELKFRVWSEEDREYRTDCDVFRLFHGMTGCPATIYNEEGDRFDIEQYTGLKDKNGKEIYEGDIVRWSFKVDRNSEPTHAANAVKWEAYAEEEWPYSTISGFALPESEDGYEVIGNIHEIRDSLEEEECGEEIC